MNDEGYKKEEFKGSINEANVKTASDWQLKNMLSYYEMAIEYHKKEQNPQQVIFFQSGLNLVNKRLKQLEKNL